MWQILEILGRRFFEILLQIRIISFCFLKTRQKRQGIKGKQTLTFRKLEKFYNSKCLKIYKLPPQCTKILTHLLRGQIFNFSTIFNSSLLTLLSSENISGFFAKILCRIAWEISSLYLASFKAVLLLTKSANMIITCVQK